MASCSSLDCISSAMDDLQLLENLLLESPDHRGEGRSPNLKRERPELGRLKLELGILRTFLLSARKWGNEDGDDDASLGELVIRMDAAISNLGQEIHSFYLTSLEDGYRKSISKVLPANTDEEFESFSQEINQWYSVFSDCSSTRRAINSLVKKDDLMEFMESVVELQGDFICITSESVYYEDIHEVLQEMVTFLRNFICFVTIHGGIEDRQLGPLFGHAEFMTLSAVSISVAWICGSRTCMDRSLELLQKIIRIERQVHETCVEALIASKVSTQSFGEADEHLLRDFVDSLLFYMWQILKTEACLMILLKDQLQVLWEGLISLKTILKGNPKFDEKMRDLTRLLLCDAGLVLFSLSFNATKDGFIEDMDLLSFVDLAEKFEIVKAAFGEICRETSRFNFPRTDFLGFLDFLLKKMMGLTSPEEANSVALVNYPIQAIQEELEFLRSNFLEKIVEIRHEDVELQALWDHVVEVAYKIEFLIDSLLVGAIPNSCPMLFDSIVEEIKIIKAGAFKSLDTKRLHHRVKEVGKRPDHTPSRESKPIINNVVVGLEDEATSIINRLTRGSTQLQMVPIVGMPGLGKTTLAKKVYNNPAVISCFYTRAWCTVSQACHKKNLLLEILTCIHFEHPQNFFKMCEEDLALEVKKGLQRNRYLIVLDDVWSTEVWKDLKATFPDNGNGSRVIFTSRYHDIVASRGEVNEGPIPHFLRPLTSDESWDLLIIMLYPSKNDLPSPKLCELRMQILEMCQGLPLTIVILAGILVNQDQECWEKVVERLNSSIISSTEQCTATLELSYQNLPDNLKPCFLYFGAFPEDHEHTIEDLFCLWIAEGLVKETQVMTAEDVANDYMMRLISRSLVVVSKERAIGGVEACRVHDLLHEFCVRKGKEENFLQFVHEYNEPYTLRVPHHLLRLCFNYNRIDFSKFRLLAPAIRSLSFYSDFNFFQHVGLIVPMFKLVRVLDMSRVYLDSTFPIQLEVLVQLRYLALLGSMQSIPTSIANLLHLETFIVKTSSERVSLPDTIWNLKKLRHLEAKNTSGKTCLFEFPSDNLDNTAKLCALHTLSGVVLPSVEELDKILRQFPNIRKLKCVLRDESDSSLTSEDTILVLDFLVGLESFTLEFLPVGTVQCQFNIQFALTVRELTLSGFGFPWSKMSEIGNLSNLKVLNLLDFAFEGDVWNVEEKGFPNVKCLRLSHLNIVKWTASDCEDCVPSLRKLVLEKCINLEEIPSCLGRSTLEVIEVRDCPNIADSIEQVQEEQMDLGNSELKIILHS